MKKIILTICMATFLSGMIFCQENQQSSQSSSNFVQICNLIDNGLDENSQLIFNLSSSLTSSEQFTIYQLKEKNWGGAFALNFFLPFGIGSWVQGDKTSGQIITVGHLVSYGVIIATNIYLENYFYKNGFNESTLTEIPNQRLFVTLNTLGTIGIIGFYIYGYFRPYNFAKHYNQTLKSALHLDGVTSFSMVPYIDPVESKYGLIAEIKF